jgi:hypothetical protein
MKTDFIAYMVKKFFTDELFFKVKEKILEQGMGPEGNHLYHTVAGRWITSIQFDENTEKEILSLAKKVFNNDNINRASFHTARYQIQNGIKPQLWKHWDQSACQYSLDVCIEKTIDWELVVEGQIFNEEENSCIVFSGNDMLHWRTPYPSNSENDYVTLLFMQFAELDHWFFVEGARDGFNKHGHESDFKFRARMGYWSQPDYSNNRPICSCCDYRHVLTFEERYQREKDYWDSLVKK